MMIVRVNFVAVLFCFVFLSVFRSGIFVTFDFQ